MAQSAGRLTIVSNDEPAPRRPRGRPPGTRIQLEVRVNTALRTRLEAAAAESGHTLSAEAEKRLENSFSQTELIRIASEVAAAAVVKTIAQGESHFQFGLRMASALNYALNVKEVTGAELSDLKKDPDKLKWIEEYVKSCLAAEFALA